VDVIIEGITSVSVRAVILAFVSLIAPASAEKGDHGPELPPADTETAQAAGYSVLQLL